MSEPTELDRLNRVKELTRFQLLQAAATIYAGAFDDGEQFLTETDALAVAVALLKSVDAYLASVDELPARHPETLTDE